MMLQGDSRFASGRKLLIVDRCALALLLFENLSDFGLRTTLVL